MDEHILLGSGKFGVDLPSSPKDRGNKSRRTEEFELIDELVDAGMSPAQARKEAKAHFKKKDKEISEYDRLLGLVGRDTIEDDTETFLEDAANEKTPPTIHELFRRGLTAINKAVPGVQLVNTGNSDFGGLHFGIPVKPKRIKGINYPEDFYYIEDYKYIHEAINTALVTLRDKETRLFWLSLFTEGYTSKISKAAKKIDWIQRAKSISIDGNSAFKYIPKAEWFDEGLRSISSDKLLAILPEAERDTFLLHLGRIAIGVGEGLKREREILELPVEYKYRAAIMLFGEPGLGKSTLVNNIIKGLIKVGYDFGLVSPAFNQFSWNKVMEDLAFIDDLNGETIKKLFKSDHIKSSISGNPVPTERKGVDAVDTFPRAAFIMCANEVTIPSDIDKGVLDRFHFLQTRSNAQMSVISALENTDMTTDAYWNKVCRDLNVDIEALSLCLIERGVSMLLEEIGVSQTETGKWEQDTTKNTLWARLSDNRKSYTFQPPRYIVEVLTGTARKCFVLNKLCQEITGITQENNPEYDLSFNAFTVLHIAKTIECLEGMKSVYRKGIKGAKTAEEAEKISQGVKLLEAVTTWLDIPDIGLSTWAQFIEFWNNKISSTEKIKLGQEKTFEGIWKQAISLVTLIDGSSVVADRPKYAQSFTQNKANSPGYRLQLEELFKIYDIEISSANVKLFKNLLVSIPDYE